MEKQKKRNLGKIYVPEQYEDVGEEVTISNSVNALKFFEGCFSKGGTVVLGNIEFVDEEHPSMMVWVYYDVKKAKICSIIPIFRLPNLEEWMQQPFKKIEPIQDEMCICWDNNVYATPFTSTGEVVIKKMLRILNSEDAIQCFEMMSEETVSTILPVELYSNSEHRFVCACWAILTNENQNVWQWLPMSPRDQEIFSRYDIDDLKDCLIKPDETVVIHGLRFKLVQDNGNVCHFEKLPHHKCKVVNFSEAVNALNQTDTNEDIGTEKDNIPPLSH